MRFLLLHHDNPLSLKLWSGTPANIARYLQAEGHAVAAIGNLKGNSEFLSRVKTAFYKYILGRKYIMNRDWRVIRRRAPDANRKLREAGPADAILITTAQDAAYLETETPIFLIHDATWTQLLDYYPGLERSLLCEETKASGVKLDRMALEASARSVYSSEWAARQAVREFGVEPEKVKVISFGANLENPPSCEQVGEGMKRRGQGALKLFFMGVEWQRKGADIAVAIARQIAERGQAVELHVVGCQPPEEVRAQLPEFVKLHGRLERTHVEGAAKLNELYLSSDFFCVPTRADATPIVFAEAAAYGLPILASETGGVAQMAREPWAVRPALDADVSEYVDWALGLYKNRAEYERVAWLARDCYEQELNWPAFSRSLAKLVESVKAERKSQS